MEVAFIVNVMSESGENVNLGNPVKEANQENQVNWLKMSIIGQHQNTNKEDFFESLTQFLSFILAIVSGDT